MIAEESAFFFYLDWPKVIIDTALFLSKLCTLLLEIIAVFFRFEVVYFGISSILFLEMCSCCLKQLELFFIFCFLFIISSGKLISFVQCMVRMFRTRLRTGEACTTWRCHLEK